MVVRAHVWVEGRVQGVSFRAFTRREAQRHGVLGWVRNLADRRVEAVFEGSREAVEALVGWCATGSPAAAVEQVTVEWEPPQGETGFVVRA